jgi:hypothetical protein
VWVGRDNMNTMSRPHFVDCANKTGQMNNRKVKHCPHGIPYCTAQIGAARSFTDKKSVNIKSCTISDKNAEIFRVRQSIDCNEEAGVAVSL